MLQIGIQDPSPIIMVSKKLMSFDHQTNNNEKLRVCFRCRRFKKTVDVTLLFEGSTTHRKFANGSEGISYILSWFRSLKVVPEATLFCMESTGLYCFALTRFLTENKIDIWVEHAARIKSATALARVENDKVGNIPALLNVLIN